MKNLALITFLLGCATPPPVSLSEQALSTAQVEAQARAEAQSARAAYRENQAEAYARASTRSVLRARKDDDARLLARLRGTVSVAAESMDGLEGTVLSLLAEASARGLPAETLVAAIRPIAAYRATRPLAGRPQWMPVSPSSGYGARYLRTGAARAGLAALVRDPLLGLDAALDRGLCSLSAAELVELVGQRAATQLSALCDTAETIAGGGELGGGTLSLVSDFECLLQEAGLGAPAFDEQLRDAAIACAESIGGPDANPYAQNYGQIVETWTIHYPDGSVQNGSRGSTGEMHESWRAANGCLIQIAISPDGSVEVLRVTPNRQTKTTRYDPTGKQVSETQTPGYDADCSACAGESEPLAGEPYDDPDTEVADGDEELLTPECKTFEELLWEHNRTQLPEPGSQKPRDRVTYPTGDQDPAVDAESCLSLAGGLSPARLPMACGVQMCALGEVPDPVGCGCEAPPSAFDADFEATLDCTTVLNCPGEDATVVNGACTCGSREPGGPLGGPFPPPDPAGT